MTCVSVISLYYIKSSFFIMLRTVSLTMKLLTLLSHNLINFGNIKILLDVGIEASACARNSTMSTSVPPLSVLGRPPRRATVGLPARAARGERRRPATTFARSPPSPEVIRRNGALVLSRTHPVLTSPASPAVFSMTREDNRRRSTRFVKRLSIHN